MADPIEYEVTISLRPRSAAHRTAVKSSLEADASAYLNSLPRPPRARGLEVRSLVSITEEIGPDRILTVKIKVTGRGESVEIRAGEWAASLVEHTLPQTRLTEAQRLAAFHADRDAAKVRVTAARAAEKERMMAARPKTKAMLEAEQEANEAP